MTKIKFIVAIIFANMMFSCGPMSKEINLATLEEDIMDIKNNITDLDSMEIVCLNSLLALSSDLKYFKEKTNSNLLEDNGVTFEIKRNEFFDFIHKKGYSYSELLSEIQRKDEIIDEFYKNNHSFFKTVDSICLNGQKSINILKDSLDKIEDKTKISSINWFTDMYHNMDGDLIVNCKVLTLIENNNNEAITGIEYNFIINNELQNTVSKPIVVQPNSSITDTFTVNKDDLPKYSMLYLDMKKYTVELVSVSFTKHKVNYLNGSKKSVEILNDYHYKTPKKLTLDCPYIKDSELNSRIFNLEEEVNETLYNKIPAWTKLQELLKKLN